MKGFLSEKEVVEIRKKLSKLDENMESMQILELQDRLTELNIIIKEGKESAKTVEEYHDQ